MSCRHLKWLTTKPNFKIVLYVLTKETLYYNSHKVQPSINYIECKNLFKFESDTDLIFHIAQEFVMQLVSSREAKQLLKLVKEV